MLALLLLGFAARVWHLGTQSLWLDEALSVVFVRPSLRPMFSILVNQDLHPPLYYLLLHFWIRVAGQGEFAARFPSVVEGLPVVAATYALGSSVLRSKDGPERSRVVGVLGASFATVSPFLVYYAQEARMYSLLASLGVLSSLALWKLLHRRSRIWWLAYVGFTAALMYTQYFGALVLGFQGLYLLGTLARDRRAGRLGLSGILGVILLYLPWLPAAYRQMDRLVRIPDFWKGSFQLSYMVSHVFAAFAFGQFAALGALTGVATVLIALAGLAFAVLAWRAIRHGGGELYLLAYLLVPFAALYVVLVRDPKFTERYLIAIAPPFYLVFALGVVAIADRVRRVRRPYALALGVGLGGLLSLALLAPSLTQLAQVYNGPGYRKDDNRAAFAYIEKHYQPGDVVVLMMNAWESMAYYTPGNLDWAPLQPGGDRQAAANELNQIARGHRRMWLVLWNPDWADPTFFVRQSVSSAYTRLPVGGIFTGLDLQLYQIDPSHRFAVQTVPDHPEPVNFGNRLQLLGYDLKDDTVTAGQKGKITLYWKAVGQPTQDYVASLRLSDGTFAWSQQDGRPAAVTYPTNYWRPDQVISADRDFDVPAGTPPGVYRLDLGVYPRGGADLNVLQNGQVPIGNFATIAEVTVRRPTPPPDPAKLGWPTEPNATIGDGLHLLGARLGVARVQPGAPVDVTLYWQALRSSLPDQPVRLQLKAGGTMAVLYVGPTGSGRYPTSRWTSQELVADRYRLVIPPTAPPGSDHLILDLPGSPSTPPIDLGPIEVLDRRRLTAPPSRIQNPTDYRLGAFARLVGYDVSAKQARPGDTLHLTLYWHASGGSGRVEYTVFAHLLDQHSIIFAQQDHQPDNGNDPTGGWIAGEYIVDNYDLTIKPDAPPGPYQIEVGMYDPDTVARLPVADAHGKPVGDRVLLGAIQVVGK